MEADDLVGAILKDKEGTGVRSRYPRYYVWENGRLWLIGWIGLLGLPAGDGSVSVINHEVAEILDKLKIQYRFQNIIQANGSKRNISLYQGGGLHEVLEAIHNSVELEVSCGARRRGDLRKLLHRKKFR